MVDLAVTPSQVVGVGSYSSQVRIAGATIVAGDALYLDSSNQWLLADANVSATEANAIGIALNGGDSGQPVTAITNGTVNLGAAAAAAAGVVYVVSATAGNIAPDVDVTTGAYLTILGVGIGSNQVKLSINASGVVAA